MTTQSPLDPLKLYTNRYDRYFEALILLLILGCLLLPLFLTPELRGVGTHQQLGLPPCPLDYFLGVRCATCGMTTSFAHMVRGEWNQAFVCHILGPGTYLILFGLALVISYSLTYQRRPFWWGQKKIKIALDVFLIVWLLYGITSLKPLFLRLFDWVHPV